MQTGIDRFFVVICHAFVTVGERLYLIDFDRGMLWLTFRQMDCQSLQQGRSPRLSHRVNPPSAQALPQADC